MNERFDSAASKAQKMARQIESQGTPERAEKEKQYLKSDLDHFGVTVPKIRSVVKPVAKELPSDGHDYLMDLATELWGQPVHELRFAAASLLADRTDLLTSADLAQIEIWLRESRTWALVDTLTPYPVGRISQADPEATGFVLDRWADDEDFWVRRAALLAHLIPLREGNGDWERFARYADQMLEETQFFVRKAIGWILRDTSRKRSELVRDWVAPRTGRMSGVTIREAVKRLDAQDRERLMLAYREKRAAT